MTDQFDQAQRLEAFYRDRAIDAARKPLQVEPAPDDDCEDCGDPIDPERRRALPAVRTCVTCQEARERRARECRG